MYNKESGDYLEHENYYISNKGGINKVKRIVSGIRTSCIFQYFFRLRPINPAPNNGRFSISINTIDAVEKLPINKKANQKKTTNKLTILTIIAFSLSSISRSHFQIFFLFINQSIFGRLPVIETSS